MQTVEASTVFPLGQEETWDFLTGDQLRRLVALSDSIVAVEDYQMRSDGTPRYRMVQKAGPFTISFVSDYSVYDRPHRTVNRTLDSPLGGTFYSTFDSVPEGTRVSMRWEVEPQNPLVGVLLPVLRPLLSRSLQRDLETLAKAVSPQGERPHQQQDQQRRAASVGGLLGGGVVAAGVILALYFLARRRRKEASRRGWRY